MWKILSWKFELRDMLIYPIVGYEAFVQLITSEVLR
jgi:hypothetical protein